ncbi:phenylalanine--tRNA ligase subunit beta [Halobacteriales archaeon QS_3_64_16]|nr:MAG: phenylalanine--tRNA ligase subunit beta [Halobacteriales archaeon QS_3_64_16]
MVVVDVDFEELRWLTGQEGKSDEELKTDLFALGMEYEGETGDGLRQLEFAPDRLDRLSVEGIARSLRYQYGEDRGVHVPRTNSPEWRYEVAESVPEERPYVTGAIARGVNLDETALDSLIQLQEKLHATMGRDRVKGAIGIHDLVMLKGGAAGSEDNSIEYRGVEPDEDTFVPLDADAELSPGEVLTEHPTGREYAPVIADYERLPAIYDEIGLFSFPPVINGRRTELEVDSTDLLIELTGTDQWTIDRMGVILCYALAARGATIEEVTIEYPDRELVRPDLGVETKRLAHERIETVLGIDLATEDVIDLAERSGLDAEVTGSEEGSSSDGELSAENSAYEVSIPPYRQDVLGPLDLIDDLGRAYGFNDLEPRYPRVSTVGGRHERSRAERKVRETLVGLGFEDLLDFHLIAERENYDQMGLTAPDAGENATGEASETREDQPLGGAAPARIREPYSEDYEIVRTWALPSLMMVLENNTHRSYPQDLAEIGLAAGRDAGENTGLAEFRTVGAVLARTDASYEAAKSRLAALCRVFGAELETPPTDHPAFIGGRAAEVRIDGAPVGVIGEIHPEILVEHDLEVPVAAFEFRLDALR